MFGLICVCSKNRVSPGLENLNVNCLKRDEMVHMHDLFLSITESTAYCLFHCGVIGLLMRGIQW